MGKLNTGNLIARLCHAVRQRRFVVICLAVSIVVMVCVLPMLLHALRTEEPREKAPDCFHVWIKADGTPVQGDDGKVFRLNLGESVGCLQVKGDRLRIRKMDWDETVQEGWMKASDALEAYPAHRFFTQLIEKQPKEARAYLARSSIVSVSFPHDPETRLPDLDAAIRLAPESRFAYAMRATLLHFSLHRDQEALADYSKVIQLEPKLGLPFAWRGRCFEDMGRYEEAVEDYTKAIARMRPSSDLYKARAELLVRIGEPSRALADLTEADRLDPGSTVYGPRLDALLALGEYEQVLRETSSRICKESDSAGLFRYRAEAYACTGHYAKALADFAKAATMKDEDSPKRAIFVPYARFLATCPDASIRSPKNALALAVQACRMAGSSAPEGAYDERAARKAERTTFEEQWVRDGWRDWRCLDTLAAAYAACGDFDKAVRWQTKAIDIAPKRLRDDLRRRLQLYQERQPFRLGPTPTDRAKEDRSRANGSR